MIGLNEKGLIVLREKVSGSRIGARLVNVRPCLVGMEAGMATHYMAHELVALGDVSNRCRRLLQSRFGKATGMTSGTPRRLRRPCNAVRHAAFR
jgi:hypothetical protein